VSEDSSASATRTTATTAARDVVADEAPDTADEARAHGPRGSGAEAAGTGDAGAVTQGRPVFDPDPVKSGAAVSGATVSGAAGERCETKDQVTVRLPAEGAYLSVLRTATAGLAARLDFTLDEIEDLRIAVDEACAMLLGQAVPGASLECAFTLGHDVMTIAVTAACLAPQQPATDTFAWTVLTALAGSVDAHVGPGDLLTIVLRKTRESSGSV
jgi:serine/threonine-protein kinase RsbW